jgi:hypothetical protein
MQLATNLSEFASSPLAQLALQQAQITDAAVKRATSNASNGGNTANSGGLGPNDPWNRFSELLKQGRSEIDAAVEAATQGKGDRFVIGPYNAPPGTLNYIEEANGPSGGKYLAWFRLDLRLAHRPALCHNGLETRAHGGDCGYTTR